MKPIYFSMAVIAFASFFCSCQKEITNDITEPGSTGNNSFLIKTYTEDVYLTSAPEDHAKDSFLLTHDDKGRLLQLVSADSANGLKFIYQYDGDKSFTMDQYENNALSLHEVFYLNSFSYVDSTRQDDTEGDTTTEKYIYDVGKKLTNLYIYDYTTAGGAVLNETDSYEYDADGNIIKESFQNAVTNYAYTSNTVNNLDVGLNYFQQPKRLPDSVTTVSDGDTETATHIYTFDSLNRLIKDMATSDKGYIIVKTYGY